MKSERTIFRLHAVQRMFQGSINEEDIYQVLEIGETIEEYPDDTPYPSRLILGWVGFRPIHVVLASNSAQLERIVITETNGKKILGVGKSEVRNLQAR